MSEYKPNTEEAMAAYRIYKKHQWKLRWIPFYKGYNKRRSIRQAEKAFGLLSSDKDDTNTKVVES